MSVRLCNFKDSLSKKARFLANNQQAEAILFCRYMNALNIEAKECLLQKKC